MRPRSIRVRLTVWYSAILALALASFGALSWLTIRHILIRTIDDTLKDRVEGVRRFMEHQTGALSVEEIRDEFKEHSVLGPGGDLFQVCDARGVWLYRSVPLENGDVPIPPPSALSSAGQTEGRVVAGSELRFLARRVEVRGSLYTVQVAAPMDELKHGLAGFGWALVILTPLVLLVAATGGGWMSKRALQPVDRIIESARSIGEQSLAQRLPVPATNDELQRLSETLNQMLARIEGAFRRIVEFTADASHELRTPVALIRTSAELALRKPREAPDYRQALEEVHSETLRTTDLIENLLTLARADAGKAALDQRQIDLVPIVREASMQAEKLARAKNIEFRAELPGVPLCTIGDEGALRRLLLIVIDNAVKYTKEGQVTVRLLSSDGVSQVQVSDTGVGIASGDLPRIFERFYRADQSRSRDSGGAGLGLAIAKWIVEAHHGSIEAQSRPHQGSTFLITLPLAQDLS